MRLQVSNPVGALIYSYIMNKVIDEIINYLNSSSKEELNKNWKHLEPYENIGPNADKWIECIEK